MNQDIINKFWSKVKRTDNSNDCWEWQGAINGRGYGHMNVGGKDVLAHRIACKIAHGEIGKLHALHRCDNTKCCNPDHLFPGTHQDNVRDRVAKGRSSRVPGELSPRAVLTTEQVQEIRRLYADGMRNKTHIAQRFGISRTHAHHIISGKRWPG